MTTIEDKVTEIRSINAEATDVIQHAWDDYLPKIVAIGQRCLDLQEEAGRGKFPDLCARGADMRNDPTKLPFSLATAEKYMRIARHPYLQKPSDPRVLPKSVDRLYSLAAIRHPKDTDKSPHPELTIKRFEAAITKKYIRPNMDEEEVRHAIYMSKPSSERDIYVPPEKIHERRYKAVQNSVMRLQTSQKYDLYQWLGRQLGEMDNDK